MFLYIFTIALILANIICFVKHKYPHLFFACLLFLPEYYAIELSESLPLISATRIMYIILYIYVLTNYRQNITLIIANKSNWKLSSIKKLPTSVYLLAGYFIFRIITNLYYITIYSEVIMTLFRIIFEQLFLCIAIFIMKLSHEETEEILKSVIYTSAIIFLLGIVESISGYRITDSLYTVSRTMLNDHYPRLGLLRSTVTLGLPGIYGNYCVMLLPLIMLFYDKTKQKRYLLFTFLNLLAVIHSGSRSSMLFAIMGIFLFFLTYLRNPQKRIAFLKSIFSITGLLLIVMVCLSIFSPKLKYYYSGTGKSLLNEFGFEFDLDAEAPEEGSGYGGNNASGSYSRAIQFSGISYAAHKNPIFGLGTRAQNRGDVYYYYLGKWRQSFTYDVGYVELFMNEGILGILGFLCLIASFFIYCTGNIKFHHFNPQWNYTFFIIGILYLTCLLSTANMYHILFFYIVVYFHDFISDILQI